ncbi:MAG: FtsQ-type POTRA domain-containing protein [Acidobacteriota bacterium]|nr:FtsQ-type POTRA domain-containing protein [Acidobacteriota bacterium]
MREQVIAHKVGNRSGIAGQRRSSAVTQRPAPRASGREAIGSRVRALLGYFPAFFKIALAIVIGVLIFAGYRAAASASFFHVRNVEVQGTSRASSEEIQALIRHEVEQTGVWKADLNGINERLERLPWVRKAIVSRVLPDGIRVRIVERVPRAVVRTASGRFRWIDEDAVLLGEMLPTDQVPAFFLRGLNEEDSEAGRKENRERAQKFLELQRDWDAAGLSERVSEVNLIDIRDVRAQLAGDNSQIEVRLGSQDHGKRLKDALDVLDGQRQTSRGSLISYIDLSQGKRAIVGLTSGVHTTSDGRPLSATTTKLPTGGLSSDKKIGRDASVSKPHRMNAQPTRTLEGKTGKDHSHKAPSARTKPNKSQTKAGRKQ